MIIRAFVITIFNLLFILIYLHLTIIFEVFMIKYNYTGSEVQLQLRRLHHIAWKYVFSYLDRERYN